MGFLPAQDSARTALQGKKPLSGAKKRPLRQKTLFDRDNIKMGTILLFLTYKAAVKKF